METANLGSRETICLCPNCHSLAEPLPLLPVPVAVRNHAVELAKYGYSLVEKNYPKAAVQLKRIALTANAIQSLYEQWPGGDAKKRCMNPQCGHVFR